MADNPQIFDIPIGNVKGPPGNTGNGISSIALLQTVGLDKTYRITMTDETHYDFTVTDGNGITGVTFNPETYTLTLTFDDGTSYTTGSLRGAPGAPGNDGISPAVTITTITGGHRVTITDRDHPQGQTFDVMDGAGNVTSVAGKTGAVALDGNDISFDQEDDYDDGTVGKALKDELNAISQLNDASAARAVALNNLIKKAAFAEVLSSEYIDFLVAYGFNLFDPSTSAKLRMYIDVATMTIKYGNGADRSAYIRIKPNTRYRILKDVSKVFRVGTTEVEPALNVSVTSTLANHNGTEIEITSGSTDQWLFITYFQTATSAGYDEATILNSIKVFEV